MCPHLLPFYLPEVIHSSHLHPASSRGLRRVGGRPTDIPEHATQKSLRTSSATKKKKAEKWWKFSNEENVFLWEEFELLRAGSTGTRRNSMGTCCKNAAAQSDKDQSEPTFDTLSLTCADVYGVNTQ